tara:strand:- start:2766 stop:4064 length:1299 start_codon:yes stop_codon:yes gene_type:complete
MKIKKQQINFFNILILIFMFSFLFFGRSLSGVFLFGYRLGEYIVLLGLLIYFLFVFLYKKINNLGLKHVFSFHTALILSFIISSLLRDENLIEPYMYKASLYMWVISFFYFGNIINLKYEDNIKFLYFLNIAVFINYIFTVVYYPNTFINFFVKYSDKFDFNKAHMAVAFFVIVTYGNYIYSKINLETMKYNLSLFFIISGLYFPIFIFKSRGAFLSALIYSLYYLYLNKDELIKNKKIIFYLILLFLALFFISSYFVSGSSLQEDEGITVVSEIFQNKDTSATFLSLYIDDFRLFSTDGNINWRLQIWQDVFSQGYENNWIFFGFGYENIIPAMDNPDRSGYDGTNENVHNFLVNIFARGGLLSVTVFTLLIIYIFRLTQSKNLLLLYMLPFVTVSFFDASMENPHFPAIFYFFMGYFIKTINNNSSKINI